ncbi:glycosyltransferase family 2 protein [Shewanella sp. ENK2]|uniref:glycosyltransferase family 2 protein n=1 Tax=Shewanella sp. ENK2 TaxID=2775245 RepID=UPI0037482574
MKVSIIMPTYNVGDIVLETIDSVLKQTHKDWELIVVDDASNDNTPDILDSVAKKERRIKLVLSKVNGGAGVSRNLGLDRVSGRFVAFLDSDDLWEHNKLEKQINHMLTKGAPISHTSFTFISVNGQARAGKVEASKLVDLEHNLKHTEIGTSTAMIDLEMVHGAIRFSTIRARQDLKLWIDLLSQGYVSHGLNIPLVKYRVRNGSVSSNKLKMLWLTLKVYIGVKSLPLTKRLTCYVAYVLNAIRKRNKQV